MLPDFGRFLFASNIKNMQKALSVQSGELAALEAALGHSFTQPELLIQALTHRSQAYEAAAEANGGTAEAERADNERLEFLGDAVLGLVVADALFKSHPDWQEGELTRLRAQLVSRRHMADVASAIGLGEHLRLGRGEERSGGRRKLAILANAMEAVIAAMYLDAAAQKKSEGGLEPVRRFARNHILGSAADDLARELRSGAPLGDHKSALQEHLQATRAGVPVYLVESESGPDHRKRFRVELRLRSADGKLSDSLARGTGSTKKKAEQEAARRGLALLAGQAMPEEPAEV
jgi:ribonuclease-3